SSCTSRFLLSFPTRRSSDLRSIKVRGFFLLHFLHFRLGFFLLCKQRSRSLSSRTLAAMVYCRACVHVRLFVTHTCSAVRRGGAQDRKSTRLNSSHVKISYAV